MVPQPEIEVGNATLYTKLKELELLEHAINEIQNEVPNAIIMSICRLD